MLLAARRCFFSRRVEGFLPFVGLGKPDAARKGAGEERASCSRGGAGEEGWGEGGGISSAQAITISHSAGLGSRV